MKKRIFNFFKKVYKKLPIGYKNKNKLKAIFYRIFGFLFKDTTSYRVWNAMNIKDVKNSTIEVDVEAAKRYVCNKKIAVHLHLFYIDLLDEFVDCFNHIPYSFDILVSIVDKDKVEFVKEKLEKVQKADKVIVKLVNNRGRDVLPLISAFREEIMCYDIFMHVHSKKSLYTGGEQTEWRRYLLDSLIGSEDIVRNNIYLLENSDNVGLLYPETYKGLSYIGHSWLKNIASRDELLERIGVNVRVNDIYVDYPMGTMFWGKVLALRQFFDADIKETEFPKEGGQNDGTIAHAFERCLGVVCRFNGYNLLIYDKDREQYYFNYGLKNMHQYQVKSHSQMQMEIKNYDNISFDIFDTLISRKVSPSNVLRLVEMKLNKKYDIQSGFYQFRKTAENQWRLLRSDKDCDIKDIYDELKKITKWDDKFLKEAYDLEISEELRLSIPKTEIIKNFNSVKTSKSIKLISDMYLTSDVIELLLKKNGISEYGELLVSCETNMRKDNGTMWNNISEKFDTYKFIHVGDNEVSDAQVPGDQKINVYHILSSKALFQLSNLGKAIGEIDESNPATSAQFSLILNRLFNDPFAYNESGFNVTVDSYMEFGYCFIGPIVTGYILWLLKEAVQLGSKKILFFAREGYVFKQVFENIKEYLPNEFTAEYLYVSRRALSFASIQTEKDIEIPLEIFYEGKIKNLIATRYGIEDDRIEECDIRLPDNKSKVLRVLEPYKGEILNQAKKDRENYLKYFQTVAGGIIDEKMLVSDIGYSGTIQEYLSRLTGKVFDGRYIATDDKKKPLSINGNTIKGYYIDGDESQELSESNIHRYYLILESVLIAPDGQLLKINDSGEPVFSEEQNELYCDKIAEIHKGIVAFAKDYADVMQELILDVLPNTTLSEQLIASVIKEDILSKDLADIIKVDDKYCRGEITNAIEYYKRRSSIR